MTTKITQEGHAALRARLEALQQDRMRLRDKIAEARQVKDAEEFDLIDELTQLALLEKHIAETEHIISHCQKTEHVVTDDGTVQLGAMVELETPQGVMQCRVVNAIEADPASGRISDRSPLGSALLGKTLRALVKVKGPRKSFTYRVLGISAA